MLYPAPSVLAIICALVFATAPNCHNGGINGLQSVDCHHVAKKLLGQDIAKKIVSIKNYSEQKVVTKMSASNLPYLLPS